MHIDKDKIASELGFKRSDFDSLLAMFSQNASISLVEMEKSIDEKDMQGIVSTSHAIAGSAGSIQLNNIYELAKTVELAAKNGENADYRLYCQQLKTLLDFI